MKFLIDEQLPFLLAEWLQQKGYDAVHVTTLATGKRLTDSLICQQSIQQERIVITKDDDFLKTYHIRKQPYKLVYLTSGNLKNRQLLDLFRANFEQVKQALETANVVEFNQFTLKIWH